MAVTVRGPGTDIVRYRHVVYVPLIAVRCVHVLGAAVFATSCAQRDAVSGDTALTWPDSTAAEYTAHSIGGQRVIAGTRVTVVTSAGGVGGYTGCNWYGLRRDSAQARPGMEMTARGCTRPAGVDEQERRFGSLLPLAVSAMRRGDTLSLRDSSGTELLVLLRRHATPMNPTMLLGTRWRLRSSTWPGLDTTRVTLGFEADSARGFGGCRDFVAAYTARADRIRFTYLSMTQLDCANNARRVAEENLTTVLSETSHFEIRDSELSLMTFGGDTLRFAKNEARSQQSR